MRKFLDLLRYLQPVGEVLLQLIAVGMIALATLYWLVGLSLVVILANITILWNLPDWPLVARVLVSSIWVGVNLGVILWYLNRSLRNG